MYCLNKPSKGAFYLNRQGLYLFFLSRCVSLFLVAHRYQTTNFSFGSEEQVAELKEQHDEHVVVHPAAGGWTCTRYACQPIARD
jgi:hypothetical protein